LIFVIPEKFDDCHKGGIRAFNYRVLSGFLNTFALCYSYVILFLIQFWQGIDLNKASEAIAET
jgi:hypothetical protein